jgi:hypothetical protein
MIGQTPSNFAKHHEEAKIKISKTPLAFIPSCYAYQHGWVENSNSEETSV